MHEEETLKRAVLDTPTQVLGLRLADPVLKDAVRAQGHRDECIRGAFDVFHLPRSVAAQDQRAAFVEERLDPLIVVYTAVDQANGTPRIEALQHQRLEQAGYASRGRHGIPEPVS